MWKIPTITKNLLIINGLMFVATYVFKGMGTDLTDLLGLHFFLASDFRIYQLFTYMFLHANIGHIISNMFALWMFGCVIENTWGPKKFLFYYIFCGIGAGLMQELVQFGQYYMENLSAYEIVNVGGATIPMAQYLNYWNTIGASGAVYAILLAFGMTYPDERIFFFPLPVPIKAKWFICIYIVIELVFALGSSGDQVAHFAHLGGMLFGYLLIKYWQKHPYYDGGFGQSSGRQFFDNLRSNWEKRSNKKADDSIYGGAGNKDWEYNARKKEEQEEVDRILDKIKRSGYDSLTEKEKKKLFDNSNKDK